MKCRLHKYIVKHQMINLINKSRPISHSSNKYPNIVNIFRNNNKILNVTVIYINGNVLKFNDESKMPFDVDKNVTRIKKLYKMYKKM